MLSAVGLDADPSGFKPTAGNI